MRYVTTLQAGASALLLLFAVSSVQAQSITLSGSSANVADADEYFTDVQGVRYDFSDPCQVGIDQFQFSAESTSGGHWVGTNGPSTGTEMLILPSAVSIVSIPEATNEDCFKFGNQYPLNASKYTEVSWRGYTSVSSGAFHFLWDKNNAIPGSGWLANNGYFPPGIFVPYQAYDWNIYRQNLAALNVPGNQWSGTVNGIMLRPNTALGAGGEIGLSWMRLVDMNSSPSIPLSWNSTGEGANAYVHLYMDYDNTDYNGDAVERFLPVDGSTGFKTGVLPPGTYYFYAELARRSGSSEVIQARSNHIGPVTINGKATMQFDSPGRLNVDNPDNQLEYFRDVVGNPSDCSDASDFSNLDPGLPQTWRWFHDWSFQNGMFIATPDVDPNPDPNIVDADMQLHFTIPSNKPIRTADYRYFCTKMTIEWEKAPRTGEPADLNDLAHILRLAWTNTGAGLHGRTKGIWYVEPGGGVPFPSASNGYDRSGMQTYCIDLWDEETLHFVPGEPANGNLHWLEVPLVTHLRHDPTETQLADPPRVAIDHSWLLGPNKTDTDGHFPIEFTLADAENDTISVQLFYDTDNSGYNGTLITTLNNLTPGAHSYNWDASALTPGTYYIHASVSDGANLTRYYAKEPVQVGATSSPGLSAAPIADFDGDGKTDSIIVRRGAANQAVWYKLRSSAQTFVSEVFGNTVRDVFLPADVDGDGINDTSIISSKLDYWISWHELVSSTQAPFSKYWGIKGDVPLAQDFDGDGKTDFGIVRPSDFTWWVSKDTGETLIEGLQWGLDWLGDIPVPADYDGDGKTDIAVWRNATGEWYVRLSSKNYSTDSGQFIQKQWGLPGDHPMVGDYTGDGKADLVVWRSDFGLWYICTSDTNYDCSQGTVTQYGLWFDYPVYGDFDGDGIRDIAVWRPTTGFWFIIESSSGIKKSWQWGLGGIGDMPITIGYRQLMGLLPTN